MGIRQTKPAQLRLMHYLEAEDSYGRTDMNRLDSKPTNHNRS